MEIQELKNNPKIICLFMCLLIIVSILLFACNNHSNMINDTDSTNEIEQVSNNATEQEIEPYKNSKELCKGNIISIKKKEYKSIEWEFGESDFDTKKIDFLILDYDDEKVLVTEKEVAGIDYNSKPPYSGYDLKDWKRRFKGNFNISSVYNNGFILSLEPIALSNIMRNEELDADVFIMSKNEIEKYFMSNNIDSRAIGLVYNNETKKYDKKNVPYILRDSYMDEVYIVDENGQITNYKSEEKHYNRRLSMYLKREYVEKLLSGYYDEKEEQNIKIKEKYANEKIETSADGKLAYVKDYTGGRLDVKKYGKYEILDFSKNESEYIPNVDRMFGQWTNYSRDGGYYDDNKKEYIKYGISLKEVRLNGLNLDNCYSMEKMFSGTNIEKVDFTGVNLENIWTCYKVFNECANLKSIKGLNLNSKNLVDTRGMFFKCQSLKELELLDINTEKVSDMGYMFYRCQNLETLDVSRFNTINVTDMSYMFGNMRMLIKLEGLNFNTEKVTNMSHMFYRCEKLEYLDLSSFKTYRVSNFSYMFYCCYNLKNIDISNFDTSNATTFSYFMYFCNSLDKLDFDNLKNSGIIECDYMFRYCENLKTLNMRNAYLPYFHGKYIFEGCISLMEFNFDLKTFDDVSKKENIGMSNYTRTGSIDDELVYRIEKDMDATLSAQSWNGSGWNFYRNAENIKKQINDLSLNKELIKYYDRQKNISNRDIMFMENNAWRKLLKNEFLVKKEYQYKEFYNYYEEARYNHFPNFVTTDSMLHTYHLYFDYLMKKIEKTTLYNKILDYSKNMLEISKANYINLKGTIFENNAKTIVAYFSIPIKILDEKFVPEDYVKNIVDDEISQIESQSYIGIRSLFSEYYKDEYHASMFNEDYTQFKPRGHYTDDENLQRYFKTLMWYGRVNFASDYEELNKCAMLISCYMNDNKLLNDYKGIKNIIYYFAGESDDNGIEDYINVIKNVYGDAKLINIMSNPDKYNNFVAEIKKMKLSSINSTPLMFDSKENNVNFRLIGQTYTYDEDIFTNMVYDKIKKGVDEKKRYLPDFLDVPACLNSDLALKILKDEKKADYPNYIDNLNSLRKKILTNVKNDNKNILYNKWMKALYRLVELEKNDEKLPSFMKNEEWKKKTLETFGGSYAELKHDTILYTKLAFGASECGEGGGDEFYDIEEYELDDKGYVEPVVELYKELKNMSLDMKNYFFELNLLDDTDVAFLDNFSILSEKLEIISNKELNNIDLEKEEYELIEGYGATIEHLVIDSGAYKYDKNHDYAPQPSSAIIADVATGDTFIGDFKALEIATGNPIRIFILVKVGNKYKICQGAAYDFYQFEVKATDRMNDIEWRCEMGFDEGYRKTKSGDYIDWNEELIEWAGMEICDSEGNKIEESDLEPINSQNIKYEFQNWTNSYKEKGMMFSERINTYFINHCGSYRNKNICVNYEEQ